MLALPTHVDLGLMDDGRLVGGVAGLLLVGDRRGLDLARELGVVLDALGERSRLLGASLLRLVAHVGEPRDHGLGLIFTMVPSLPVFDPRRALSMKEQAEQDLIRESRKQPITRLLETAPGIGPIRVARLLPIVVTPHRFRTRQQFWSYCGLGIVMRTSSDWIQTADGGWIRAQVQRTRGLTRQHNHVLKDIFKGAATTVVTLAPEDPIYVDYQRMLKAGTKPNLAKLTLARKIAATVLAMWKKEERYTPETARRTRDLHREG